MATKQRPQNPLVCHGHTRPIVELEYTCGPLHGLRCYRSPLNASTCRLSPPPPPLPNPQISAGVAGLSHPMAIFWRARARMASPCCATERQGTGSAHSKGIRCALSAPPRPATPSALRRRHEPTVHGRCARVKTQAPVGEALAELCTALSLSRRGKQSGRRTREYVPKRWGRCGPGPLRRRKPSLRAAPRRAPPRTRAHRVTQMPQVEGSGHRRQQPCAPCSAMRSAG